MTSISSEVNTEHIYSEIRDGELWINLGTGPWIPEGFTLHYHKKGEGWWKFDPAKLVDYLTDKQQEGDSINGYELFVRLQAQNSFNSNLIDGLMERPEFIPEEFKDGKRRFAWNTIIRHSNGDLYVRCLCWVGSAWHWGRGWLGRNFDSGSHAVLANSL